MERDPQAEGEGAQGARECASCGARGEDLLRCSRCRSEWFCSLKCHKSFWPVHRMHCQRNEFADAIEAAEPKFAAFLRKHGKQAVLGDGEVERLERAGRAVLGPSRDDVMASMYGRVDPRPAAPTYSAEELAAMAAARAAEAQRCAALALDSPQGSAWHALPVPEGMGMDCGQYKWRQNLSHVEVFWRVPPGVPPQAVKVTLAGRVLRVCVVPWTLRTRGRRSRVTLHEQPTAPGTSATSPAPPLSAGEPAPVCGGLGGSSSGSGSGSAGPLVAARVEGGPADDALLEGALYAAVQLSASTWYIVDGVLHVVLLKAMRKGRYAPGATAADTFWRSLWATCPPGHTLDVQYPPSAYYLGAYDGDDLDPNLLLPARPAPRRLPPPRGAHSSQQQQGVAAAAVLQAS